MSRDENSTGACKIGCRSHKTELGKYYGELRCMFYNGFQSVYKHTLRVRILKDGKLYHKSAFRQLKSDEHAIDS